MTKLLKTVAELLEYREGLSGTVALVPTMGALHNGHLTLIKKARALADHVIVSDFVNPLQFGPGEDYERYPRTLDEDLSLVEGVADVLFAPEVDDMYPHLPPRVSVKVGPAAETHEGAIRPGHFDGVATVVTKLFTLARPDIAIFGQKDAQQLFIIRALNADLNLGVEIVAVPIARDVDDLALSSRNRYLSEAERTDALAIPRLIRACQDAAPDTAEVLRLLETARADSSAKVKWDYCDLLSAETFAPVQADFAGEALVVLAGRVGSTRLIDNTPVTLG